jgi:hypothetical protein
MRFYHLEGKHWVRSPVILATWEDNSGTVMASGQTRQKEISKTNLNRNKKPIIPVIVGSIR